MINGLSGHGFLSSSFALHNKQFFDLSFCLLPNIYRLINEFYESINLISSSDNS